MTTDPDVTQNETPKEEVEEAPLDITQINSWEDAKDVAASEFDKLRNTSADEVKDTILRAGNRLWDAWKRLREG